ncbi:MAG: DUF5605 domain-containing protein [Verrucomicrobiota bacterium]|nr:DUF5605 domain-containing protein [Verrucomicrobiota bacterium]
MNTNPTLWSTHELRFHADDSTLANPFAEVQLSLRLTHAERVYELAAFYDGEGTWKARIMPDALGEWEWLTTSNLPSLHGMSGRFLCEPTLPDTHGPVRVEQGAHFRHVDGTRHLSFGTTCYAWLHQPEYRQEQTLQTLRTSPFNKLRFCIFPKWYDYNRGEPDPHVFEQSKDGSLDFMRPNLSFFRLLDKRLGELASLGIMADIILFHPYDNWNYSKMGQAADDAYLRYVIARYAAHPHIWWSLANEWDVIGSKQLSDWERYREIIMEADPYQHLCSIHNCMRNYDHSKPGLTHVSAQRIDTCRTTEDTGHYLKTYHKPVVWDEVGYEGNIQHGWGNLPATELVRRYWEGMVRGGYVGHGETYAHPDDILWWSHGGILHGTSAPRIAFLRKIAASCPSHGIDPLESDWDVPIGGQRDTWILRYLGVNQPSWRSIRLPEGGIFEIDVIDTWEMTVTRLPGTYSGEVRVPLPGKSYMAVLARRCLT